jgi:hypothetical protein
MKEESRPAAVVSSGQCYWAHQCDAIAGAGAETGAALALDRFEGRARSDGGHAAAVRRPETYRPTCRRRCLTPDGACRSRHPSTKTKTGMVTAAAAPAARWALGSSAAGPGAQQAPERVAAEPEGPVAGPGRRASEPRRQASELRRPASELRRRASLARLSVEPLPSSPSFSPSSPSYAYATPPSCPCACGLERPSSPSSSCSFSLSSPSSP